MDEKKIQKLFLETYRKYYYNDKLDTNREMFYQGQLALIMQNFSEYLGSEDNITKLKRLAEAEAEGDIAFYNT